MNMLLPRALWRAFSCVLRHGASPLLAAFVLSLSFIASAAGQITVLKMLPSGTRTSTPIVQGGDGTLYGVTDTGGANGKGSVYKIQPDGTGFQTIYSFGSGGGFPNVPAQALVLGPDGYLYGTSEFGGSAGYGALYKVKTDGSGYALLKSFTAGGNTVIKDAGAPRGGLVYGSDGYLYGCASTGTIAGTSLDDRNGVVYRIKPDGTGYQLLASFDGATRANGAGPETLTEGLDGKLYGTTIGGGTTGDPGTIFSLNKDGSGFKMIYSFSNTTSTANPRGTWPKGPVVYSADGYLYGVTSQGGAYGYGAFYHVKPDGTDFKVLYSFNVTGSASGVEPRGGFVQGKDGAFYGRARYSGATNKGFVFRVKADGTGFKVLADMPAQSSHFSALLQGQDGAIYTAAEEQILKVGLVPSVEITEQPRSQTIAPGGSVTFKVTANGATSYQWKKNGAAIAGATSATYTINGLTAANNGTYTVDVKSADDTVTSVDAILLVAVPQPGRLTNMSVRTVSGGEGQTLIVGFVVGGSGSKNILVRAVGPGLLPYVIPGTVLMAKPRLELFDASSTSFAVNAGWDGSTQLTNAFSTVGAFPITVGSADSALLKTFASGALTSALVTAVDKKPGVVLVEAYDTDAESSSSRLINVSARSPAGSGNDTLIAGFNISGNVPRTLLIRGVGPTLAKFSVPSYLSKPRLELHQTVGTVDTTVAVNGGWADAAALKNAFSKVGAFDFLPGSADTALLITLQPGLYTAQVSGVGGSVGEALIEVYEVP